MNMQPVLQSKSSSNGVPFRRGEREGVSNRAQSIKSYPTANTVFNGEGGSLEKPLRDRLVYLTTCMIGHLVDVHVKNGSVYSGIFHAADVEKDFGIILKMACMIKDGDSRRQKSRPEFVRKPPSKTLIIPADELVQVIAKDLSISSDGNNAVHSEKPVELLTDSSISQSYHVNQGRELKRWVPDENVPQGPNLENVFDDPWNRGWNQFEVNESLFGVKSTFDEDLYTTKLERGPRTRELEEQAMRIAREIEGENTRDLHVAEERGLQLNEKFDMDEETKYSSVRPVAGFDDSGFVEEEEAEEDNCNDLTFGDSSTSDGQKPVAFSGKGYEEFKGDSQSSQSNTNLDQSPSVSEVSQNRPADESVSGHGDITEGAKFGGGTSSASKAGGGEREKQASQVSGKAKSESSPRQSASRSSESRPGSSTSSRHGLSPSSSIGSLSSSKKSTLNPNAKEFKLNPNAQSFKPLQPGAAAARPQSLVSDGSFYYPATGPAGPQMPGMPPVGYGVGPPFHGYHQQQMMYHPPQTYYPPNGPPQYHHQQHQQQQQMMFGQHRPPVVYMPPPPYQPEMPHNSGRQ